MSPARIDASPQRALLPFRLLEHVLERSPRLAGLLVRIERRDVRTVRAALLLLLLELRLPLWGERRRHAWYVRGALARTSLDHLRRLWRERLGTEPPSARRLADHLRELERAGAIGRSPGELLEGAGPRRYPDTIHLLEDDAAARDWDRVRRLLEQVPAAQHDAATWRRVVGEWRGKGTDRQLELPFQSRDGKASEGPRPAPLPSEAAQARGTALLERARAIDRKAGAYVLELLLALQASGLRLAGRAQVELASMPARLEGAVALLARAWIRGDEIASPAGWLLAVFRDASPVELDDARAWLERGPDLRGKGSA